MSPADLVLVEAISREVAAEWGLELGERFALSHYSFVAPAGKDAVLKLTPPDDDESDEEADALELWAGDGAVRLLRRDPERRALLLERARPGTDLSELPEDEATEIAVEVGRQLWRPAAGPFRWLGDHVPRWLDAEPSELTPLARELYASLDVGRSTLVHGDFHHHNLVASPRATSRSTPSRCSASLSTTSPRSSGIRFPAGCGSSTWRAGWRPSPPRGSTRSGCGSGR